MVLYLSVNLAFCYVIIAWQEPLPRPQPHLPLILILLMLSNSCRPLDIKNKSMVCCGYTDIVAVEPMSFVLPNVGRSSEMKLKH